MHIAEKVVRLRWNHRGTFVIDYREKGYIGALQNVDSSDPNKLSFFELQTRVKELGYTNHLGIYYGWLIGGDVQHYTLREIKM